MVCHFIIKINFDIGSEKWAMDLVDFAVHGQTFS